MSLFDVIDGSRPALLTQVSFGGQGSIVADARGNLKKAFLVLNALGLILVPCQNVDPTSYQDLGGTQLIDLGTSGLTLRGMAPHQELIERAFPVQGDLVAFSNEHLQVIDIANRDAPATAAQLDLARQMLGLAFVGQSAIELSGDPTLGNTEIAVTAAATPDQASPVATVQLPGPNAKLLRGGQRKHGLPGLESLRSPDDRSDPRLGVPGRVVRPHPSARGFRSRRRLRPRRLR